ncbi:MAG: hypothetical protein F4091_10925 [Acidimicrobiales bacterium]|nr:hypothetical protein [Acidimicrobiales bacterium]MYD82320.1 hypothetical protein [Acidimicrobiales bacterium]MYJ65963.1 hypothetical protein [Acidimicrobiales bacterium]
MRHGLAAAVLLLAAGCSSGFSQADIDEAEALAEQVATTSTAPTSTIAEALDPAESLPYASGSTRGVVTTAAAPTRTTDSSAPAQAAATETEVERLKGCIASLGHYLKAHDGIGWYLRMMDDAGSVQIPIAWMHINEAERTASWAYKQSVATCTGFDVVLKHLGQMHSRQADEVLIRRSLCLEEGGLFAAEC